MYNQQNNMQEKLTALIINAAMDPNPTREFIFGDPLKNAFRPSESNSEKNFINARSVK